MLHDSLEILRGDILSITKDSIAGLRELITNEETAFQENVIGQINEVEKSIVELADLKACYKYLENELKYPSSDYIISVYKKCKEKYDYFYDSFCELYHIEQDKKAELYPIRLVKGYEADAGVDVLLDKKVTIMPMSTMAINLNIVVTPEEGKMGVLCARTSAANKGLCVAMCPIDANYSGEITAIVHNVSNKIITYNAGEAFCQIVMLPVCYDIKNATIKKPGKRTTGKLGSTGNASTN
jgi:dUTPase